MPPPNQGKAKTKAVSKKQHALHIDKTEKSNGHTRVEPKDVLRLARMLNNRLPAGGKKSGVGSSHNRRMTRGRAE